MTTLGTVFRVTANKQILSVMKEMGRWLVTPPILLHEEADSLIASSKGVCRDDGGLVRRNMKK
jgi:hypothetical protein